VTFLFTDVESSTVLLRELGADTYAAELARHRKILREAFDCHGGVEVDTQGDAFFVAFASAREAVGAAVSAQEALRGSSVRVRMGLHTGEALLTDQGYVGMDVHRAARIAAVAHGGQVLLSRTTRDLVGSGVQHRDLGEHRLKDLSAPERLYQLGDGAFPPLRSLYQTNMPIPSTPFLGREKELAEIAELLSRNDVRLVTLTGAGGTGKTRLAAHAAGMASGAYPDGIWWVPLAAVRDHDLVLETARQVLGAATGVAEHIGDQSILLLFDNFEHVVEAADGIGTILASCPNLNVLATSREPLHVGGEHEYPVPTLRDDEAVALFVARAISVDRSFEPGNVLAEICRRLDNLPLAIELAAARVKALSAAALVERLEQRLPLLTGGARTAPQRQRTLRATIEWSYELLTTAEQRLFARLAVFAGGCTLRAAEEVAQTDIDTLQSLIEKSLLRHGRDRYWMLETIREFAQERLTQEGGQETVAARHVDYFVALAERAEPFFDTRDEALWSEKLARENDNFRAALSYSENSPTQLRLACALWKFWLRRGHHSEGRRWLEVALIGRADAPESDVARALRAVAVFARIQGDFDAAERSTRESISIARRSGDRALEMHAIGTLANLAQVRRDYSLAAELMAKVDELARELGDDHVVLVTLCNRAYLAVQLADFDLALTLATEALDLSRETGDKTSAMIAALNLALAARALGKRQSARDAVAEAIELARVEGHVTYLVDGLIVAAAVIAANDASTAALLLAAADRAQKDMTIELEPVEQDLRALVESQVLSRLDTIGGADVDTDDLDAVLSMAATRALESLALPELAPRP
jgi:predicted ATPase